MIRAVSEASVGTDGVVGTVTGRTITVTWNSSKKCKMHRNAALTTAAHLEARTGSVMRIGVATGTVLHGNVGTAKARFTTMFGSTLDAAEAVADHTVAVGVFCLYADCSSEPNGIEAASLGRCIRLVDSWFEIKENRPIYIYHPVASSIIWLAESWGTTPNENEEITGAKHEKQSEAVQAILSADESTRAKHIAALREMTQAEDTSLFVCLFLLFQASSFEFSNSILGLLTKHDLGSFNLFFVLFVHSLTFLTGKTHFHVPECRVH